MARLGAILCAALAVPASGTTVEPSRRLQALAAPTVTVTVNPSADVANHGVYADAADAACALAGNLADVTPCTGGVPGTIALNRGMCVNANCWDICNGQHEESAYVGANFDADLALTVPLIIQNVRGGLNPNVSCPAAVQASADRETCGDHDRSGELCTPVRHAEDRENLGMCILPNMGQDVECRDMCAGDWSGTGWHVGLTDEDRQQIADVQGSWACGYPWNWLWYFLLFLLVVACIVGALFLVHTMRMRNKKQPKSKRGLRPTPEPQEQYREPVPEPMQYQPEPPPMPVPVPVPVPQVASIRMQQPMLAMPQQQSHMMMQTMAPQMTSMQMQPMMQSQTRGAASQQGTFYNPMTTRMPQGGMYQGLGH